MSFADEIYGPWIAPDQVPSLRRDFTMTDPLVRAQYQDLAKTEAQRREEQGGRSGGMADHTRATYEMHPPQHIREPVLRAHYNAGWMAAQRAHAMAQAAQHQPQPEHQQAHVYQPTYQPRR